MRRGPAAVLLALLIAAPVLAQSAPPTNGRDLLIRMRARYEGRWYRSLTFVQKTSIHRPDGSAVEQTWYETLLHDDAHGTRLRIDQGDLATGNGVLYTADSSWRVRNGTPLAARPDGNFFLPLIEGVYVQPVERTVQELAATKVKLDIVSAGEWAGKKVWIVGAQPGDSTSPQFWVEQERLLVVRALLEAAPNQPPLDVRLGGIVAVPGGWLATDIQMLQGGAMRQREEYRDWKVGGAVNAELFDVAKWKTAVHWARQ